MADFRINVIVDPAKAVTGTRKVRRELNRVGDTADRVRKLLARAFAVAALVAFGRALVDLADTFTLLQNRLGVVTTGQKELTGATEGLLDVSNRTRSSFRATAELYTRVALATRDLGTSSADLLTVTEAVNQAIILSGASAKEANNGLIQLSQGIASNRLAGDELRSTLEQLPVVADVIAKELGLTRGQLRDFAETSNITADVIINAFKNAADELETAFKKTVPTIGQSLVVLKNNIIALVGEFNIFLGSTLQLGNAIRFLGMNLEAVVVSIVVFAATMGALKLVTVIQGIVNLNLALAQGRAVLLGSAEAARQKAVFDVASAKATAVATAAEVTRTKGIIEQARWQAILNSQIASSKGFILSLAATEQTLLPVQAQLLAQTNALAAANARLAQAEAAAATSTNVLTAALARLRAFVAANIVGFLVIGLTALAVAVVGVKEELDVVRHGFSALGKTAKKVVGGTVGLLVKLSDRFMFLKSDLTLVINLVGALGLAFTALAVSNPFGAIAAAIGSVVLALGALSRELSAVEEANKAAVTGMLTPFSRFEEQITRAEEQVAAFQSRLDEGDDSPAIVRAVGRLNDKIKKLRELQQGIVESSNAVKKARFGLDIGTVLRDLDIEARNLKLGNREREVQIALLKIEKRLRGAGFKVDPDQRKDLETTLRRNQLLRDQADVLEKIQGPQDRFNAQLRAAVDLQVRGAITLQEFIKFQQQLREEQEKAAEVKGPTFESITADLNREIELLGKSADERERLSEIDRIRADLAENKISLDREQVKALDELLKKEQEQAQLAGARASLLQAIITPRQRLNVLETAARQLLDEGNLSLEQRAELLDLIKLKTLELDTSIRSGLQRGLIQLEEQLNDVGSAAEDALVNAFQSMEDALVELVRTGEFNFREFATNILADISRIVARMLVLQAFEFFAGKRKDPVGEELVVGAIALEAAGITLGVVVPGLKSAADELFAAATLLLFATALGGPAPTPKQHGGSFEANQSLLVGEEGPEIVRFNQAGAVIPADESARVLGGGAQQAPIVNVAPAQVSVNVVNVTDPDEAISAMSGRDGEQVVINHIRNNRQSLRREFA